LLECNVVVVFYTGTVDDIVIDLLNADQSIYNLTIIVLMDAIFEGDNIFELRLQNNDDNAPFLTRINGTVQDTAVITIVDCESTTYLVNTQEIMMFFFAAIHMGFVQTSINVTEDQGSVKICVREYEPESSEIEKVVYLGILTINGSAGT